MNNRLILISLFTGLGFLFFACQHGTLSRAPADSPAFKKVVLVLFENEDIDKPLSQPFFTQLAHQGALLNNYHAVTHPSEPNYIALTSGSTQNIADDGHYDLAVQNLADLLETQGKTWKSYAEDYPGNCFQGMSQGNYARKHVPFMSYSSISSSPHRCANIVNAAEFATDVQNGTLPDFSFYSPNMDDDGHNKDIIFAENWFQKTFAPLLVLPGFRDVLLVVTFDENECNTIGPHVTPQTIAACKGDTNQVYTVYRGPGVRVGAVSNTYYDHYNLLKTLEWGLGLGDLGQQDASAAVISDIWQ